MDSRWICILEGCRQFLSFISFHPLGHADETVFPKLVLFLRKPLPCSPLFHCPVKFWVAEFCGVPEEPQWSGSHPLNLCWGEEGILK